MSAQCPEAGTYITHEKRRLLERREVPTPGHFGPVTNIGISGLHPTPHRRNDLLRKHRHPGRYVDLRDTPPARPETLPIKPGGRGRGAGSPVQHDIVEQFIATE